MVNRNLIRDLEDPDLRALLDAEIAWLEKENNRPRPDREEFLL